jgi:hypothetical protein
MGKLRLAVGHLEQLSYPLEAAVHHQMDLTGLFHLAEDSPEI